MESNPLHITSTKTPSHTHITWLNSLSPQLSHLITYTEPMKYGEINTRINSLAGPADLLTHSPTSLNNLEEKFASLTALPGLLPSPYSDVDTCLSRHQQRPSTTHFTKQPLVHTLRLSSAKRRDLTRPHNHYECRNCKRRLHT
jgi:hypothetical protein